MAEQQNNLWEKCRWGRVEQAREALAAGADPNARGGPRNDTCLMWATFLNHDRVVELLLSTQGIQVNAKNEHGWTAIMWAISGRHTQAVLQMAAVPDVCLDVKDNQGRSLEEIANQ